MNIRTMQKSDIAKLKQMIAAVAFEILRIGNSAQEFLNKLEKIGDFSDIEQFKKQYSDNKGHFFVVTNTDKTIVGSGAIRKLHGTAWELKRMWITKEYRRQGIGKTLYTKLVAFAKNYGATTIKLDIFDPEKQTGAVQFYKRLGFYETDPYEVKTPSDNVIFMEKAL